MAASVLQECSASVCSACQLTLRTQQKGFWNHACLRQHQHGCYVAIVTVALFFWLCSSDRSSLKLLMLLCRTVLGMDGVLLWTFYVGGGVPYAVLVLRHIPKCTWVCVLRSRHTIVKETGMCAEVQAYYSMWPARVSGLRIVTVHCTRSCVFVTSASCCLWSLLSQAGERLHDKQRFVTCRFLQQA